MQEVRRIMILSMLTKYASNRKTTVDDATAANVKSTVTCTRLQFIGKRQTTMSIRYGIFRTDFGTITKNGKHYQKKKIEEVAFKQSR